ncbi:MAG: insulinase family protein [Gemmatimonadaceae bacterium]|nr:insulinase family protein [Gemmatimonadaceae bacterium]
MGFLAAPLILVAAAVAAQTAPSGTRPTSPPSATGPLAALPIIRQRLANGMRVVMSPERYVPTVAIALYYDVGSRNEEPGRTGFAHLFEHMMFQGSANLGKMEFIKLVEGNGGLLNGSTRFDFTNYYQVVPAHTLETVLWAEADRMKGLAIDSTNLRNQQDVVKNEVRVNVLNQPYGTFPWIDLPMTANENWYNAHNFYGELSELEAATLEDAAAFFRTYYAPNNAVLAIVGDFEPAQARQWVEKYFAGIARVEQPARPDLSEPRQEKEKRASRVDQLANRPALGIAYHVPPRWSLEWYAMGLIDQILGQGRDAKLYDALVQRTGLTSDVSAGINWGLGNMFNYEGPMLWMVSVYHDRSTTADSLLKVMDVEIESLRTTPVDSATLARARTKMRSSLYSIVEEFSGLGKLDLLASFALFDDDPSRINRIEDGFAAVTPDLILRTANEYLRPTNRTVYTVIPGAK